MQARCRRVGDAALPALTAARALVELDLSHTGVKGDAPHGRLRELCSSLPCLATLRLVGVHLGARAITSLAGLCPVTSPRAPALQCLVLCGGADELAMLGPLARRHTSDQPARGGVHLDGAPSQATHLRARCSAVRTRAYASQPTPRSTVRCSPAGVRLEASSGQGALGLLVFLLPHSPGGHAPPVSQPSRQSRRPTLSDLPHLAAYDERVRYTACELLALRHAAGLGPSRGSRPFFLPRGLLRDGAGMMGP